MKLPKELKKKKISTLNKKNQIYAIFKKTFTHLNNIYKPHYSVKFLKMGQRGKYSNMVTQELKGYSDLNQKHFLLMAKEYENIEFYINWERLGTINLKGEVYYDLHNHFEFYKNLYRQMAYHEYGHTYLITSSSTIFYPNEAIQYLKDNKMRNIYDIPENKLKEFKKVVENSKQNQINQNLSNINFMDIAIGVAECHANYTMRNVLKLDAPIEFLKQTKIDLLDGLHDYSKFDMNEIDNSYLNQRINNWVIKANDLFIYDKMDTMKKHCENYGFMPLLNFAYELNFKYLEIIKNNKELSDIKNEILSLAVETNKFDFRDLLF